MARGRDTRGERERPPESPVEIVYSLFPRVSLSRASFFTVPITSKRLLRRLGERHKKRVRAPAREPRGNRLLPLPSRDSIARTVLSCAHYFQAPATQAGRETRKESASARPRVLWESFTPSPLACLSRAPHSFLCPLLPSACYVGCLGLCLRYASSYGNAYAYACACVASEDRALQGKAANNFFIILQMLVLTSLKLKGPNLSLSLFP